MEKEILKPDSIIRRLLRVLVNPIVLLVVLVVLEGGRFLIDHTVLSPATAVNSFARNYPLLDTSRAFYKPADLIVNVQPLRDELNAIGENKNVSMYFEFLNTGANIAVNKDAEYFPASLLKVPLVMAVVKKIEDGEWKWSDEVVLTEADKNSNFGDLWRQPVGEHFTVEALIRQLLVNSDDTAYFMLLRNVTPEDLHKVQEHLGIQDFFSHDMKISAKKYAPILRSLHSASYLSVQDSEKILQWMSEYSFNNYLASGLPRGMPFAHKIGIYEEKGVYLDAGIVYVPQRPYILIVMVNEKNSEKAQNLFRDISQKVYGYISGYK